jgi:glycerol-3-phosphate dehydrogenase (NAD(P)+)
MSTPVAVVGGGVFGRAVAKAVARTERDVILWSRSRHEAIGPHVHPTNELAHVSDAALVFVAVPSSRVPEIVPALGEHLDGRHLVVHVSRGLVSDALIPLSRYVREVTPCRRVGVLAGPLVAEALDAGTPAGAIVGTLFPEIVEAVRGAIAGPSMRLFATDDVIGVEVASALVGVLLVGAGLGREIGLGSSTLSVFLTRGLAEATAIGAAMGARDKTFSGMAGTGDLLAAISGDERPETRLGRAIAKGASISEQRHQAHVEAIELARRVAGFAERNKIEAPVLRAIADVVERKLSPADAVAQLMSRNVTNE